MSLPPAGPRSVGGPCQSKEIIYTSVSYHGTMDRVKSTERYVLCYVLVRTKRFPILGGLHTGTHLIVSVTLHPALRGVPRCRNTKVDRADVQGPPYGKK